MMKILLASGSPRRIELMRGAGFDVRVAASGVDESFDENLPACEIAKELALRKASAVVPDFDEYTVGADTSVVIDGKILGKPHSAENAKEMLSELSGRTHEVYTGVAVIHGGKSFVSYDVTKVKFAKLSPELIDRYVATGEPMDKAGAYGIQHFGPVLVEGIEGDYFNVMGLPLHTLFDIFKNEFGIAPLSWLDR